jgi:hypothetical protein
VISQKIRLKLSKKKIIWILYWTDYHNIKYKKKIYNFPTQIFHRVRRNKGFLGSCIQVTGALRFDLQALSVYIVCLSNCICPSVPKISFKDISAPTGQNDLKFGLELQYGELYNASPFSGLMSILEISIYITYM